MAKHDRAKLEKRMRNGLYAKRFQQGKCEDCGHRSGKWHRCRLCGGFMRQKKIHV